MTTGTKDKNYDLISALYHVLQGAHTCGTYLEDAKNAGDSELEVYFQGLIEQYQQMAEQGKSLLKSRL